jgi:hypothetical protein
MDLGDRLRARREGVGPGPQPSDPHATINEMRGDWVAGPLASIGETSAAARVVAPPATWAGEVWGLLTAALLMVIGLFGPWVTALGVVSRNGLEGDGLLIMLGAGTLAVGALATTQNRSTRMAVACLVPAVIALLLAVGDYRELAQEIDGRYMVSIGWGLYATVGAAFAAAVLTLRMVLASRRPRF